MGFDEVIRSRRSIRGFKTDPLPRAEIEEIVSLAIRAPSSYNSQPWHIYVAASQALDAIRRDSTERTKSGTPPSFERRESDVYQGDHRQRQIEVAVQLFESMGIGSVINSQGVMHSPVVREHLKVPDDQVILISVAMGYPDEAFPANAVVSRRRSVAEVANFIGFD